jgi:SAM-dependent methyltransferase
MDPMLTGWLACPRCGGDLADRERSPGVRCLACGHEFGARDGVLDLVDATQRVSSEGPGDTLAMAWRRRRWDELRGSTASENAAYLSAIWERLRPDDRVLDLGCGPGSFLGWMAEFAPDLALLGLDLAWPALEEAARVAARHPNVRFARASTRRRLPLRDGSTDVVLRRLAPGLPEEIARVLAPDGHYLRFTFGPGHWREIYDRVPGLPRAREEAVAGESARLADLGLEVLEPIQTEGEDELTLPAVMLALRSNPAAFHMAKLDLDPMRELWFQDGERKPLARLSTEYVVLVARKPPARARAPQPAAERPPEPEPPTPPAEPIQAPTDATPVAEPAPPRARRRRTAATSPATDAEAAGSAAPAETGPPPAAEPPAPRRRRGASPAAQPPAPGASAEGPAAAPRARRAPKRRSDEAEAPRAAATGEPAAEPPPSETPPPAPGTTARPRRSGRTRASAEPSD